MTTIHYWLMHCLSKINIRLVRALVGRKTTVWKYRYILLRTWSRYQLESGLSHLPAYPPSTWVLYLILNRRYETVSLLNLLGSRNNIQTPGASGEQARNTGETQTNVSQVSRRLRWPGSEEGERGASKNWLGLIFLELGSS